MRSLDFGNLGPGALGHGKHHIGTGRLITGRDDCPGGKLFPCGWTVLLTEGGGRDGPLRGGPDGSVLFRKVTGEGVMERRRVDGKLDGGLGG